MPAEAVAPTFRGVECRRCGKPVRVPALVAKHECACQGAHDADDLEYHLISQVFVLRCRSCRKESIYTIHQIADFSATQVSAITGTKEAALS